jgi:hypothetical protein
MSIPKHCPVCGGYRVISGREADICNCPTPAPQAATSLPPGTVLLFLLLRIGFVAGLSYVACFRDWSLVWLGLLAVGVFVPAALVSLAIDKWHQLFLARIAHSVS